MDISNRVETSGTNCPVTSRRIATDASATPLRQPRKLSNSGGWSVGEIFHNGVDLGLRRGDLRNVVLAVEPAEMLSIIYCGDTARSRER